MAEDPSNPAPEEDLYELDDSFDDEPAPPPPPPGIRDAAGSPQPAAASAPDPRFAEDDSPSSDDPAANEPASVSPEKAKAKREEQRIRAAEELAIVEARKKKVRVVLVGIGAIVMLILYIVITKLT